MAHKCLSSNSITRLVHHRLGDNTPLITGAALTGRPRDPILELCGSSSVVESLPSKQAVAGSNPVSRSSRTIQARRADSPLTVG